MNKVYVVYESRFGDLLVDCEATKIIGVYTDIEKARNEVTTTVKDQLFNDNDWVIDENNLDNNNELEFKNYVCMFFNEQENWDCYYEIHIEEMEVK